MNAQLVELYKAVLISGLEIDEKKTLLNELRKLMAPEENRWHFRYVIWTLSLIALSIPVTVLWSIKNGTAIDIPSGLLSLGSAAVGALAAFLAPSARRREADTPELPPIPAIDLSTKLAKETPSGRSVQSSSSEDRKIK